MSLWPDEAASLTRQMEGLRGPDFGDPCIRHTTTLEPLH